MKSEYPNVGGWFDIKELEEGILRFWEDAGIFEKLCAQNAGGRPWSFIDGPITANNPMGIHHAWGRALKDAYQRYHAMNGRRLRYQNGFDCQGLWVEVEVEKELGFQSKRDIESFGIGAFVERCKERVLRYADVITHQSKRLGYWMDWDNSYYTMSEENNYTIWSFLAKCHARELVYRGHDVMPWCPRCGTGISQHEMSEGYKDVEHLSLYVALPIRGRTGDHLVVWTTTPWTLPANVAVAVNPELTYAVLTNGDERYYVESDRAEHVARLLAGTLRRRSEGAASARTEAGVEKGVDQRGAGGRRGFSIERRLTGRRLLEMDLHYRGPFDDLPAALDARDAHRVIPWDEVTGEEGTGLVHIAPGCGEEDNALGRELDLPALAPVDEAGRFVHGYGFLTGREAAEVGPAIAAELEARGLLVARERYRHSYPHCWRCGRELIYRLVDEWYIAMDPWRDEIKRVVEQINWIPSYGRELELDWLSNMRDWMISKKRYWGLALPIWINEDGSHFEVLGSRDELERRAVRGWREFEGHSPHRPWIDSVKILSSDGETLTRIPDVGNPWLDAGIVPYSTTRYSTDRDYFDRWVPADLVLESFPGQFRNWFYSLLAMSTMMEGIPPFRSLVGHATVRDADGEEMHKSKGNAIWFDDAVETIGADVIRWLFFSNDIRRNVNFSFETAGQIRGRFFNTVWNSHAFFVNYARIVGFDPDSPAPALGERPVLDRWILVQLRAVVEETRRAFERYEISSALRRIEEFAESLSNWYIRHSRRRFWRGHNEDSAFHTLYECLTVLCRLLAPLVPMLAEAMYRNITAVARNEPESVHLSSFPTAEELPSDDALSDRMSVAIDVTAAALHARKQAGIKVRQPLSRLQVAAATESEREAIHELADLIRSEVNVKELDQRPVGEARPVQRVAELDLRKVGPKHGKRTPKIVEAFNADPESVAKKIRGGSEVAVLQVDGQGVEIGPDDLTFRDVEPEHLSVVDVREGWTAIDVRISRELRLEGLVREVIRKVQVLRRESGLEIEDRIRLTYRTDDPDLAQALSDHRGYLQRELLATTVSQMEHGDHGAGGAAGENETVLQVDGRALEVSIAGVGRTVS